MTTQAYEDALGDTEWPEERYGKPGEPMEQMDKGVEKASWKGDHQMANLVLWMRDSLWLLGFCPFDVSRQSQNGPALKSTN